MGKLGCLLSVWRCMGNKKEQQCRESNTYRYGTCIFYNHAWDFSCNAPNGHSLDSALEYMYKINKQVKTRRKIYVHVLSERKRIGQKACLL